ncbi:hypothetical protein G3A_02900 [Bacillus sp. 17376]|uniref:YvrJ family protein n=1 Tax=Mesobacillus boroniphilus JCM 21738 TaxID=1294265 RepID=W4RVX4_9BACI|nr:YvrJ family protein [Mesobacillus boroniphilus]ESU34088.1 hypothetical protein G3A_02900 [Bacillus sp. 17376]GAE47998.1 hypothetical protein JCM21738_5051 [Mesobacillus boroniphilus JCM 21738]
MSTIDIPVWTTILGNFGFPVMITIYLFLRFERKLEKLEEVILKLAEVINQKKEG